MPSNTIASLDGWFKKRYGKKALVAPPEHYKLLKTFLMGSLQPVGEEYVVPVTMKDPSGFTYANSGSDAFALEPPDPGKTERAKLTANQIVLQDAVAWEAQSISEEGYDSAYGPVFDLTIRRMRKRFNHRLESSLLYGGTAIGTVAAAVTGTSLTMAVGDWSPGEFIGAEGQSVEIYNGATKVGEFKITGVDPENYKLYGNVPASVANYTIWWKGSKGKEMIGIYTALGTSGTLWNINNDPSANGYSQWKANSIPVGGQLTWDNFIQKGVERASNKGAEGDLILMVNPSSWRGLMNDEAGLRHYDSSYDPKKAKQGFEDIQFHGQNGVVTVMAYPFLKNKDALLLDRASWIRIGSQEPTFRPPGVGPNDPYIQRMERNAGFLATLYTNQTIFSEKVGANSVFTGIVPT